VDRRRQPGRWGSGTRSLRGGSKKQNGGKKIKRGKE